MKRYKHNLSHYHLFTGNMGELIPAACVEVLPGDTFRGSSAILLRANPLVAPVMHPVQVRVHHWFVPNRIAWGGWENWIVNTEENAPWTHPTIVYNGGALGDRLGLPTEANGLTVNALPIYGYNKIYNEFYRDQEIQDPRSQSAQTLAKVGWEKDHLTTARAEPQRGDVFTASVTMTNASPVPGQEVGTVAVDALRHALAAQRFSEARSRFGNRYTEYLQYLGIKPSDARLNRPEYLGGGKQMISFSEVLATADSVDTPIGTMKGHGIAAVRSNTFTKFFEEHGFFFTFVSVRPKAIYNNNVARKWKRNLAEEYYRKELELEGQEEVLNQEVYCDPGNQTWETWGYQDRYYYYKRELSRVSGQFRDLFNYWHLAREFASLPGLNSTFITCDPSKRIFADQTNDGLLFMAQNDIKARRMVRRAATPRTL